MPNCPICQWSGKNKGAVTQHIKREHGDNSLGDLMAKYGTMAPRPGGAWRPEQPLRAAPSGIPSIDYAIGIGGLPRGCIVEIFGVPAGGKTITALTFSAYAQQHGGLAGYLDAEHRFQVTMAKLIPNLDLDTLNFGEPDGGEVALNMTKDFVSTGLYDVWTVDSVHGCVPAALRDKPIGAATMAELAKLMSAACQVLDPIVAKTNTVLIFVNHVKDKPGVQYGKTWSKPGGSALDYYASVQLHVRPIAIYMDKEGRKIGHTVRVKVDNSKVAAPFAEATYDLFYRHGKIKKDKDERDGQVVAPGIDIGSCWFSVCEEAELIRGSGGRWSDTETGELLGLKRDVIEMLEEDCSLRQRAHSLVYDEYASGKKETAAAAA